MKELYIAVALSAVLITGCNDTDHEFSLDEVKERVAPAKQTALKCKKHVEQDDIEQATVCLDELRAVSGKGSPYQEVASEFYQRGIDDSSLYNDPEYQAISEDMDEVMAGGMEVLQYVNTNKAATDNEAVAPSE